MTSQDSKSLSNSERLASIQGEAKLDGVPCRGVCTTTYGDLSCGTCGRSQEEITHWNTFTSHQKKLISGKSLGRVTEIENNRQFNNKRCN